MIRSFFSLSLSSLLAQFLTIAFLPIITRLYSQEDFGDYQLYSSILLIFSPLISLSYPSLVGYSRHATHLVYSGVVWAVVLTSLLLLFFYLFGYIRSSIEFFIIYTHALSTAIMTLFMQFINRLKLVLLYSVLLLSFAILNNILKILFSNQDFGYLNIVISLAISNLIVVFALIFVVRPQFLSILNYNLIRFFALLRKSYRFQIKLTGLQMLGLGIEWLPLAIMGVLGFKSQEIAFVGVAHLICRSLPYSFGNALYLLLLNNISQGVKIRYLLGFLLITCLIVVLLSIFNLTYGEWFFSLLFGKEWSGLAGYIYPFIPGLFSVVFFIPLSRSISVVMNKADRIFLFDFFAFLLLLLVILIFNIFTFNVYFYIFLANLVLFLSSLLKFTYLIRYINLS